jgi:GTP cyclohydrolase I
MRDLKKLKIICKDLLKEIGENPNRSGLKDTPQRMAKMYLEVFKGYDKDEMPKVTAFDNDDDGIAYNQIICDQGKFNSFCEHHMALFQGDYYFGYIPDKRIIGLSKIARIIDFYSSRMQVQERLGAQVVEFIERKLQPKGIILILKASHSCKSIRGVKKDGKMTTSIVRGAFENDSTARNEFFQLININK